MDTKAFLGFFALFAALALVKSDRKFRIQKFFCTVHDSEAIQDVKCFSKPVNRSVTLMNASGFLVKPVNRIILNGALYKRTVVRYRPFLVNVTENFCDSVGKNGGGVYLRSIRKMYLPYSNLIHPCPYSGLVYARNFPVNVDNFLSIWPLGEYKLDLRFIGDGKQSITVHVFFEIK